MIYSPLYDIKGYDRMTVIFHKNITVELQHKISIVLFVISLKVGNGGTEVLSYKILFNIILGKIHNI